MSQQKPPKKGSLNSYAKFSSIVFQMVAIIAIGTFAGIKLDQWYPNEKDWFTIGFSFVSVIISVIFVIRRITGNK